MTDLRPYLRAVAPSSKLKGGDRLVLLTLAWYANDLGHAWPNSKTLAKDCGLHPTFVRRALGRLVQAGVITAEIRKGRSTVYRFPVHPSYRPPVEESTTCNQAIAGDGVKPAIGRLQPTDQPAIERLRGCNQNAPNLQSGDCTDLMKLKEEETRARDDPVDNYGDRETAARMRAILEAARSAS